MERDTERQAEIDRIKHDLDVLRARHAGYRRLAQILKWFCIGAGLVLAIVALALSVRLFMVDALRGAFCIAALLIFAPALVWLIGSCGLRWIDLATPRMRGIYSPDFFKPDGLRRPSRSEADATEQQISACEQRLSELEAG